jgi:hypothetical protein
MSVCLLLAGFAFVRAPERGALAAFRAGFRAGNRHLGSALGMLIATGWPFGVVVIIQLISVTWSAKLQSPLAMIVANALYLLLALFYGGYVLLSMAGLAERLLPEGGSTARTETEPAGGDGPTNDGLPQRHNLPAENAPEAPARLSQAAGPAETAPPAKPKPTIFVPAAPDAAPPTVPASIGAWIPNSGVSAQRRADLTAEFRDAYLEAMLRGAPLRGALGGDLVHFWRSGADRGAYVQNWRDGDAGANSWGLRGLALACRPAGGGRVSLVRGALLDAYGKGGGIGGANGIAGYGAPLGDEFSRAEGLAQRFEHGLLLTRADGVVFVPEPAPSAGGVPADVAQAPPAEGPGTARFGTPEREAFRAAWAAAVDSGMPVLGSDGPVFFSGGEWGGAWAQTFGSGRWGIVLPADPSRRGGRAKILDAPFLASVRAGDGQALDFSGSGLPLTDSFPVPGGSAQVFLKGRMETRPPQAAVR